MPTDALRLIAEHIVHRDRDLVVVDKPPGLVSGGPDRHFEGEAAPRSSVESLLVKHLGRAVWVVHQLDRNTTGLNCFVLRASQVIVWNDRLKVPGTKRYLALVHGAPRLAQVRAALNPGVAQDDVDVIVVDHALGERRDPASGKTFPALVAANDPSAKPARSRVRFIAASEGPDAFALAEVVPETGRTHQVRLHLAALGHPLVGEPIHRTPPCTLHARHALHAHVLDFRATHTLPAARFVAPLPADMLALAARLGVPLPAALSA